MAGPLAVLGHGLLEIALVVAVIYALNVFLAYRETIAAVIGVAGSLLLILMGLMMIKNARKLSFLKEGAAGGGLAAKALASPVLAGVLSTLSNPYWFIWWGTFGIGMVIWAEKRALAGVAAFIAAHIAADLLWYSFVSYYISNRKDSIGDATYRVVVVVCGIVLIGFGIYFGVSAGSF